MAEYREFQFSWLMVATMLAAEVLICVLYVYQLGDSSMPLQAFVLVSALFVVILLIFYGMTTTVNDRHIRVTFGIGLISKQFALAGVASVKMVKNRWYYGYGIRLIPNGWLYNVSGQDAVELRFHDRKRVVRIGTKHPATLKKAIDVRKS